MQSDAATDSTMPVRDGPLDKPDCEMKWWLQCVYPLALSRAVPIGARQLAVGRDRDCDLILSGREASRRHAQLFVADGNPIIRDLKSLNGTFVNGRPITHTVVASGDVIRVGELVGRVVYGSSECEQSPGVVSVGQGFWAGATLRTALEPLRKLAPTTLPILLEGETGTGKERVARAIHEWSGRAGPFVGVNCAAIPEHLAEAELFGYRKGAFTGADQAAVGHLRAAHRGTLLLDEISELPQKVQAKLLRVLEEREVQEIGESRATPIDVRIVAASRDSLPAQVQGGKFRPDLYARLNGFRLLLPSLKARREEIPSLFIQLIEGQLGANAPAIESALIECLMLYPWPGNVRELGLVARRLLGLHGHEGRLRLAHLDGTELSSVSESDALIQDTNLPRDERDVKALLAGLRKFEGNLARASIFAKVSRQRAYRLLSQQTDVDLGALRKGKA
jgi:transcriptional regulator of acetoin/glycerol metabolism